MQSAAKSIRSAVSGSRTSGGTSATTAAANARIAKVSRGRVVSRVIFLGGLAVVAAILGFVAFLLLRKSETLLAEEQFASISDRALDMSLEIALRQRLGLVTLASMAEQTFPEATTWPFVNFKGFQIVANNVIETSSGQSMGLLPLVTPDEIDEFSAFGASLFPDAPFDRVTGLDATFARYNATDGETYWGSPYKVLTPFLFHSKGPILHMADLHSIAKNGRYIDEMIACSEERAVDMRRHGDSDDFVPMECSVLTDIMSLKNRDPIEVPAAITYQPIFPANDPSVLVGYLTSTVKWEDVLVNVFSSEVSGVDCVLETKTQAFTYHITHGEATLTGYGDFHDDRFSEYGQSIDLIGEGLYSASSAQYRLTVYPSDELFEVYATTNPFGATIGAVCIILFTSALFFLYDFFVRREFNDNEALFKAKRQFVRFISHEVRTPLNSVCMGLQLLKDEAAILSKSRSGNNTTEYKQEIEPLSASSAEEEKLPTVEEQLESALAEMSDLSGDILNNAHSAVDVLNDVLNYDKVDSGSLQLELSVVQIWELIERTTFEFRQQASCKNINYVLDFSPLDDEVAEGMTALQLPQQVRNRKVIGDTARVCQVLRNLISNALKFTPERGNLTIRAVWKKSTGNVETSEMTLHSGETVSYLESGCLKLQVTDTGAGMTKDQLKNLFREGVQFNVNKLQAGQGSGLGLYIAKGMLEQHGGSLKATSKGLDCGTTFTMTIPLYYVPDAEKPPIQVNVQLAEGSPSSMESMTVLVVDDSAVSRKMLMRLLKNRGHNCDEAEDGLVAVQRVKEAAEAGKYYDSILMDNEMPKMDGPTAAQEIRALGSDAFIVGVTGNMFAEDVAHFKECGANEVLAKPLDLHVLMEAWMEHGVGIPPPSDSIST